MEKQSNAYLEAKRVMKIYNQFLKEHNTTSETVTANILWLWPDYLRANTY